MKIFAGFPTTMLWGDTSKFNKRTRSYKHIVSYGNFSDHHGVCAYPHAVSDGGRAFPFTSVFPTYGHPCGDIDILSDNRLGIYYQTSEMSDIKALSYVCAGGYLYAGFIERRRRARSLKGFLLFCALRKHTRNLTSGERKILCKKPSPFSPYTRYKSFFMISFIFSASPQAFLQVV